MQIEDIINEAGETAQSKGWHDKPRSVPELLCLMHSELSEALEEFRKGLPLHEIYYEGSKPCGFLTELADVVIRIGDMCWQLDLDLEKALELKLAGNKLREYRHGGKIC